jgi:hypothetical protein
MHLLPGCVHVLIGREHHIWRIESEVVELGVAEMCESVDMPSIGSPLTSLVDIRTGLGYQRLFGCFSYLSSLLVEERRKP